MRVLFKISYYQKMGSYRCGYNSRAGTNNTFTVEELFLTCRLVLAILTGDVIVRNCSTIRLLNEKKWLVRISVTMKNEMKIQTYIIEGYSQNWWFQMHCLFVTRHFNQVSDYFNVFRNVNVTSTVWRMLLSHFCAK